MVTLQQWVNSWIERRSIRLAPSTISSYRRLMRKYICDTQTGAMPIDTIAPEDLIVLLSPILSMGYTRQAQLVQILTNAALKDATRQRIIPWNPMECVDRIHHRKKETAWLTANEALQLLESAREAQDPFYPAWMLGLCCGLRRGEILGLKWADIDFAGATMHIQRQRVRVDGRILETPPKTDSSNRIIPLAEPVKEYLRNIRRIGTEYVIENDGKPLTDKALEYALDMAIDRAGIRRITLHGMRHTMAATAATQGVPIKILQAIMGHAQYTTTADIYAHVDRSAVIDAVETVAKTTMCARLEIA